MITNHGLISVDDIQLKFAKSSSILVEPLIGSIGKMDALSTKIVPVRIRRMSSKINAYSSECFIDGETTFSYICGKTVNGHIPLLINFGICEILKVIDSVSESVGTYSGTSVSSPLFNFQINKICDEPCEAKISGPADACVDTTVTFFASQSGAKYVWFGGTSVSGNTSQTYTVKFNSAGSHSVFLTVTCPDGKISSGSKSISIAKCSDCSESTIKFRVKNLFSDPRLVDPYPVPDVLVRIGLLVGDVVTFSAPDSANLNSQYRWSGESSGTGKEITVTFNNAGSSKISLECDNTRLSANITVVTVPLIDDNLFGLYWILLHSSDAFARIVATRQVYNAGFTWATEAIRFRNKYANRLGGVGNPIIDGDRANAAQHAYWNALMAFFVSKEFSEGIASGHEARDGSSSKPHNNVVMDLENNAIGRELAGSLPPNFAIGGDFDELVFDLLIRELDSGRMTILDDFGTNGATFRALLKPSNK